MSAAAPLLERECRVFVGYLLGSEPNAYVTGKYAAAHRDTDRFAPDTGFASSLLRAARAHPVLTRLADAYARHLAPRCLLRRKLVLLLAILETCPPYYRAVEAVAPSGALGTWIGVVGRGVGGVACLGVSLLLFGPWHLVTALLGGGR